MSDQLIHKPSRTSRALMIILTLAIHAGLACYLYLQVAQPHPTVKTETVKPEQP